MRGFPHGIAFLIVFLVLQFLWDLSFIFFLMTLRIFVDAPGDSILVSWEVVEM